MMRGRKPGLFALVAPVLAALSTACGEGTKPGPEQATPAEAISPVPRSVRVEQDSVVVEGRWVPIDARPTSLVLPNAVRVLCTRVQRACKEDLTRLADERGGALVNETLEYRVDEWTKWGKPAGKVVASRRAGGVQLEIRVSLSGLTAEKVKIEKGRQTRWRIE